MEPFLIFDIAVSRETTLPFVASFYGAPPFSHPVFGTAEHMRGYLTVQPLRQSSIPCKTSKPGTWAIIGLGIRPRPTVATESLRPFRFRFLRQMHSPHSLLERVEFKGEFNRQLRSISYVTKAPALSRVSTLIMLY